MSKIQKKPILKRLLLTKLIFSSLTILNTSLACSAGYIDDSGLNNTEEFNQFIIKYKENSRDSQLHDLLSKPVIIKNSFYSMSHIRKIATGGDVVRISQKINASDARYLMLRISESYDIEYIEVDSFLTAQLTPIDPGYYEQQSLHNPLSGVRANAAWDTGNGAGTIVAVLDTGYTLHPDLEDNILYEAGYNFVGEPSRFYINEYSKYAQEQGDQAISNILECGGSTTPPPSSPYGHGTMVSGVIAAIANNSKGGAGIAPGTKILPIRVLSRCGGRKSNIANAIIWASGGTVESVPENQFPADIINISFGGLGQCTPGLTMQRAINHAIKNGTSIVVSAGNNNSNVQDILPANCPGVITVAAINHSGLPDHYTNHGTLVDISAPGTVEMIPTPSLTSAAVSYNYSTGYGTSFSAALVSGALALLISHDPTLTPEQQKDILKKTARPFPIPPYFPIGAGMVDAATMTAGMLHKDNQLFNGIPWSIGVRAQWNRPDDTPTHPSIAWETVQSKYFDQIPYPEPRDYKIVVPEGIDILNIYQFGLAVTGSYNGVPNQGLYVQYDQMNPIQSYHLCQAQPLPEWEKRYRVCSILYPRAGTYYISRPLQDLSISNHQFVLATYGRGSSISNLLNEPFLYQGSTHLYTGAGNLTVRANETGESDPIRISRRSHLETAPTRAMVDYTIEPERIPGNYLSTPIVDLIAPDGTVYNLRSMEKQEAPPHTVDLSKHPVLGEWKLRISIPPAAPEKGYPEGQSGVLQRWGIVL